MDKTYQPGEAEPRIRRMWEEADAFRAGAAKRRDETFCVMIPPPNVTGSLHVGHAFNNTLQDILVRWHRMRGFDTLWQPGQDHAGIATQMVVERELTQTNRRRADMPRDEFVDLVWQQKERSGGTIFEQLKRLGASCDWSRSAFTMAGAPGDTRVGHENSPDFHDAVLRVFVDFYDKGWIYRGKRLVNWDPHFQTAISDLEVENLETPGHMWHFKYPLADGATYEYVERDADGRELYREIRDYISIATTRPETMLGDGAVAVHPSDERYAPIVGSLCEIPVGPKEHRRLIPIITDPYPDPAFGSGAVKITGAHDFNDYAVAMRGGIPKYRLMDSAARMRDDGAPYAEAATLASAVARGERELTEAEVDAVNLVPDDLRGLDRFEARARVVEQITEERLAVMVPPTDPRLGDPAKRPLAPEEGGEARGDQLVPLVEARAIMQPYGDRSKVVIEPMLTDQWFVDTDKIVGPAIAAVREGRTRILPEQHEKVYLNWLDAIEPWCISRQLWWGHRIPVWYGPDTVGDCLDGGETMPRVDLDIPPMFCAQTFEDAAEQARRKYGRDVVEFASRDEAHEFMLAEPLTTPEGRVGLYRDADVLDTWFSSALWPFGTLGWPEDTPELRRYFPTDVLVTGFDIIFFWVARMMMMSHAVTGREPFHTVYVHALVRDAGGKKMSKSLGNVMDPLDLIESYGADAVRFTLASMAAMGRDLRLSEARIAGYRNFATKVWNAFRFAEMNGARHGDPRPEPAETVNRWILAEADAVRAEVDAALAAYRFNDAANALYAFVWGRVCDWYLELAKPLLDGAAADETRATLGFVLDRCLILLHPFMPFVTEELWRVSSDRDGLLCHAPWPEDAPGADDAAQGEIARVIAMIEAVRSARGEMGVPGGAEIPLIVTEIDGPGRAALDRNAPMIRRLARLARIEDATEVPKGAATVAVPGGTFALPLDGVIDVGAERARLEKSLARLQKDVTGLRGRLANPRFVESAPSEVVEESRTLLAEKVAEEARLRAALSRLAEMA